MRVAMCLNVFLHVSVFIILFLRCLVLVKLHMLSTFDNQDIYLSIIGIQA